MTQPLVIGVPSKGRLMEEAQVLFARAGLPIVQSGQSRSYRGRIERLAAVEIAFLSAPEIAREVGAGAVHLGVTGRDQVEEKVPDFAARTEFLLPLGFGHCDVVVAAPEAWIDVDTMEDLEDVAAGFRARHRRRLTVATKYVAVTRRFFAGHGIADYRIVESQGATEGAPAAGAADLIVDITSTGATLRANGLKILADGVILKSEAHLVASLAAEWDAARKAALAAVMKAFGASEAAKRLSARLAGRDKNPRAPAR